jgi:hypothetical protein
VIQHIRFDTIELTYRCLVACSRQAASAPTALQHYAVMPCWGALMLSCFRRRLATMLDAVAPQAMQQDTVLFLSSTLAGLRPPCCDGRCVAPCEPLCWCCCR